MSNTSKIFKFGVGEMDIKRDKYLEDLINRMHESHIVAIELDQRKDKKYRDPR